MNTLRVSEKKSKGHRGDLLRCAFAHSWLTSKLASMQNYLFGLKFLSGLMTIFSEMKFKIVELALLLKDYA